MTETKEQMAARIFHFLPMVPMGNDECITIDDFHEWCVAYAIKAFKGKLTNDHPIQCYAMRRPGFIHVLESRHESEAEKRAVQMCVRDILQIDLATVMIASIMEVWVAHQAKGERYIEPRLHPKREDALMVMSEHRQGPKKMTKWVCKIKHNPANSRMLARDDVDMSIGDYFGYQFGLFEPLRLSPED